MRGSAWQERVDGGHGKSAGDNLVIAQQVVSAGSTENSAVCPGRSTVGTSSAESAAATPRPEEAVGEAAAEAFDSISEGVEAPKTSMQFFFFFLN